jgi:ADP-ribosyl-[dinitrogen reductase] hydrolase
MAADKSSSDVELDRFRGCLLGLAVGDAVGATVEFRARGSFAPLTDMVGGGPFRLRAGEWTDDTSMAFCLAASLFERQGFDADDQMQRYVAWWETGAYSSNGRCFDIGNTVQSALRRYKTTGNPFSGSTDPRSAGNGSIMRLAPIALFYHHDYAQTLHFSVESSRTTHAALECLDACRLLAHILHFALAGADRETALFGADPALFSAPAIQAIARGDYRHKTEAAIAGTGYVVASLEAALWCVWQTDSFESAILQAANLGDDADTTAAVCGQVVGALYGEAGIPARWLQRLAQVQELRNLTDQLYSAARKNNP